MLKANLGEEAAKELVLNTFGSPRREKLKSLSYNDLFNATKCEIYFSDLARLISKKWDCFSNSFESTKKETFQQLDYINKSRADAHAKEISEQQFSHFRLCMVSIEDDLENMI